MSHIMDEVAYNNAVAAKIAHASAMKGAKAIVDRAPELLFQAIPIAFPPQRIDEDDFDDFDDAASDPQGWAVQTSYHLLHRRQDPSTFGCNFLQKMVYSFLRWGKWSEKQEQAVRNIIEKRSVVDAERAARDAASEWVGEEGQRIEMEVTVLFTKMIETFYGASVLVKFETIEGQNLLTTFGSGNDVWNLYNEKPEGPITIRGTIKELSTYEGTKETLLSRVKVL